jgi:DNA-directed RNA polymerase sigma subunit (sigma70/sigma32)
MEDLRRVARESARMQSRLGRTPTTSELADELQMTPPKVQAIVDYGRLPVSLDAPVNGGDATIGEWLSLPVDSVEQQVIAEQQSRDIAEAFERLDAYLKAYKKGVTAHGAEILMRRYGFFDGRPWTLDEIGDVYGVTRERIRQVQNKVIDSARFRQIFSSIDNRLEHSE